MAIETARDAVQTLSLLAWLLAPVALLQFARSLARIRLPFGGGIASDRAVRSMKALQLCLAVPAGIGLLAICAGILITARGYSTVEVCYENAYALAKAHLLYSEDWSETFAPADRWQDALGPIHGAPKFGALLKCPETSRQYSFAMNRDMGGVQRAKVQKPAETVLLFEGHSDLPNSSGVQSDVLDHRRHNRMMTWAFADGHANMGRPAHVRELRWEP